MKDYSCPVVGLDGTTEGFLRAYQRLYGSLHSPKQDATDQSEQRRIHDTITAAIKDHSITQRADRKEQPC